MLKYQTVILQPKISQKNDQKIFFNNFVGWSQNTSNATNRLR